MSLFAKDSRARIYIVLAIAVFLSGGAIAGTYASNSGSSVGDVADNSVTMETVAGSLQVVEVERSEVDSGLDCYEVLLEDELLVGGCIDDDSPGGFAVNPVLACEVDTNSDLPAAGSNRYNVAAAKLGRDFDLSTFPDGCAILGPSRHFELQIGRSLTNLGAAPSATKTQVSGFRGDDTLNMSFQYNDSLGQSLHQIPAPSTGFYFLGCTAFDDDLELAGQMRIYINSNADTTWWRYRLWGYPVNHNKNNINVRRYYADLVHPHILWPLAGVAYASPDSLVNSEETFDPNEEPDEPFRTLPIAYGETYTIGDEDDEYVWANYKTEFIFDRPGPDPRCFYGWFGD